MRYACVNKSVHVLRSYCMITARPLIATLDIHLTCAPSDETIIKFVGWATLNNGLLYYSFDLLGFVHEIYEY